ncbi:MAG: hypothetical protein K0S32_3388 [Bacteroidetes bacterium]|jgi:hypothetical protein|nr:hypothetical protein [Bacteroidota bacterium]
MSALKNSIQTIHANEKPSSPVSSVMVDVVISTGIWIEVNGVLKKLKNITAVTDKNLKKVKLITLSTDVYLTGYYE